MPTRTIAWSPYVARNIWRRRDDGMRSAPCAAAWRCRTGVATLGVATTDFFLEHLAQHTQPDAHAQREQPLPGLAAPTSSPRASWTCTGSTASSLVACATGAVSFTAVPPSILAGSLRTLPTGTDAAGGPPSPQSSTRAGTTSAEKNSSRFVHAPVSLYALVLGVMGSMCAAGSSVWRSRSAAREVSRRCR